jgi:hypothetical protein
VVLEPRFRPMVSIVVIIVWRITELEWPNRPAVSSPTKSV